MAIETGARSPPISPRRTSRRGPGRKRNGPRGRVPAPSRPREDSRILHLACDD